MACAANRVASRSRKDSSRNSALLGRLRKSSAAPESVPFPFEPIVMGRRAYFFLAAQRLFAPAIILARDSGLIARLAFLAPALVAAGFDGALVPFLLAAQRAFIIAARRARPSSVSPPFFLAAAAGLAAEGAAFSDGAPVPLILAQRARVEAAILARASADRVRRPLFCDGFADVTLANAAGEPPNREASSACSVSIFSAISTARLSCPMDGVLVGIGFTISRRIPIASTVI